ncbi:conserved hypothetical protein [Theileria orientalis strain Shintoku]|uniref:FUN14 family protein n=1 Tax=Theileria orientalis strain Shintoku TaxID=869250 RepID=J4C8B8_THEOR|nr:conserved hypothetical protein [Theileria orientalis strain Shintoku]BAM40513.1 conserved hypothetical protein [Theileria orientalis strain Shintoku]|eukprot:XP_009690814.1 conserved hypothetical protein [Theileria orientalis strain Shintoku]
MVSVPELEEYVAKVLGFTKSSAFSLSSFVGGLGFGTGLSLVFTKTVRTVFILTSGGLLLVMVLNRHGYLDVDFSKMIEYATAKVAEWMESALKAMNLQTGDKLGFLKALNTSFTDSQLSSATFGLLTGFTIGLVLL